MAHHAGEIDLAIVLEPEASNLVFGEHQGFGWIDIVVRGMPAHGSAPDKGVDAIVHMAEVITRLHRSTRRVEAQPRSEERANGVPHGHDSWGYRLRHLSEQVVLGIEIGTQPGETLADRVAEIEAIFAEVKQTEPRFDGEVRVRPGPRPLHR